MCAGSVPVSDMSSEFYVEAIAERERADNKYRAVGVLSPECESHMQQFLSVCCLQPYLLPGALLKLV